MGRSGRQAGGDDVDVEFDPLLPDVAPPGPMMVNSFPPLIVSGHGAPNSGDHVVPTLEVSGLDLLALPDKGVPVLLLPPPKVCLLFLGLA